MNHRGQALIMAFWLLGMLSVMVASVSRRMVFEHRVFGAQERMEYRATAARAAIPWMLHWLDQDVATVDALNDLWAVGVSGGDDPLFEEVVVGSAQLSLSHTIVGADEPSIVYALVDEERRINLNTVTEDQWVALMGHVEPERSTGEAIAMARAIIDWRDADDVPLGGSAECAYYLALTPPYPCHNGPLDSLEELRLVRDIDAQVWLSVEPYVTVHGSGRINLNTADAVVLESTGLTPDAVLSIISFRDGSDGQPGTADDGILDSLNIEVIGLALGWSSSDPRYQSLAAVLAQQVLGITSSAFRAEITSELVGQPGQSRYRVILSRDGTVLDWRILTR